MTHALCFALDEVLVQRTRSDAAVLQDTLSAHGIDPTERLLTTATDTVREAFERLEPSPYRQSMAAVVAAAESDADPDEMVETLRAETYAATAVPDAARESLAGLGDDNLLAVITNGPLEWQVGKLAHHGLREQFDAVVASYEVGAHKPDTAPFDRVRERVTAEEYLMVGDASDVAGARAAGFVPIEYEGPELWATIDALL
jgi:putative hydrolase of the HAD superfamily